MDSTQPHYSQTGFKMQKEVAGFITEVESTPAFPLSAVPDNMKKNMLIKQQTYLLNRDFNAILQLPTSGTFKYTQRRIYVSVFSS